MKTHYSKVGETKIKGTGKGATFFLSFSDKKERDAEFRRLIPAKKKTKGAKN